MIGVDWGSSGFRAYLLAADGRVVASRDAPRGITGLTPADYPNVLRSEIGDWLEHRDERLLLSGMVGSRQGWREAEYVACPAALSDLVPRLCPVEFDGREALIVPGLVCRTPEGAPDVMRGEEVQIFGALETGQEDIAFCLPGTHSKHVLVSGGQIRVFATHMTGEVFALLRQHGLLAAMLARETGPYDMVAFAAGIDRSGMPGGLLHHLFGIRTRRLFDELTPDAALDYLSGLLIGHELRGGYGPGGTVRIIGTAALAQRYRVAFRQLGIAAELAPEHAAARGLYRLGCLLAGGRA